MIITIKNFGPIKEFVVDTDTDFLLIVGENNVGKSYAISLVYLIVKSFLPVKNKKSYISENVTNAIRGLVKDYEQQLKSDCPDELDITELLNECLNLLVDDWFLTDFNQSINNTFGGFLNLKNQFSGDEVEINLSSSTRKGEIALKLKIDSDGFFLSERLVKKAVIRKVESKENFIISLSSSIFFYSKDRVDLQGCLLSTFMDPLFFDFYYGIEDSVISCHYLPASRSGLFLGLRAFGPIFAALSQNRNAIRNSVSIPAIPEPLSDYFLEITNIKPTSVGIFHEYAEEVETNVLHGTVKFDDINKSLLFSPLDTDLSLDLSLTSSLVSEVSPITAYLKFVLPSPYSTIDLFTAQPIIRKPLVILEEPEAHIHPVNQIKLIKVLAKLVKDRKIKLIITSHSNYLFNQCSNLVMDGSIDKETFRGILFKPTETGSEAIDLEVDEYGIKDENFVDTAEEIFEEKLKLFDKINGLV